MVTSNPTDSITPIRWGIATTGGIAAKMTAAVQALPDAEVVAVGSRSQESADGFGARFGIPRAHGSYADLYADDGVDVVYVASPHSHHHAMTIDALEAGRHVLCEKAFALNTGQAVEMVDAARANHRFLMEAMWTWFIPAMVEVRRRVEAGDIGDVLVVEGNFGLHFPSEDGRHRRADLAGGALLDLGIYPLAIARFLLGEPSEVKAVGRLSAQRVDALIAGVLQFPSGAVATFNTTLDGRTPGDARVIGTAGTVVIEWPAWHPHAFTITREGTTERVEIPNAGLVHEAAHVTERIRGGHTESDVIPLATTIANMELMDEIRRQVGVVYPEER